MAEPLPSVDVLVRKSIMRNATSVLICKIADRGFRCGHCGRGFLGDKPRVGQHCKVCGAVVIQVPENQSSRTSAAGMGARRDGRTLRVTVAKASNRRAVAKPSGRALRGRPDLMRE